MTGECERCHRWGELDKHHLLPGCRRSLADADKLYIFICRECHNALHGDENELAFWKKEGERMFLKDHSFEEWMDRYGKNFLELEEIESIEREKDAEDHFDRESH